MGGIASMAWQCPKCGAVGNEDSTSKCLTCGEYSSQNEINAVVQHQKHLKQVAELQSDPKFIAVTKATEQVAHREPREVVVVGLVENGYDEAYAHELYEKLLTERREMARSG
jgi:predicted ATP-dependent serine protease